MPVQQVVAPDNEDYSYRLEGGAQLIYERLAACLPEELIKLNTPVQAIHLLDNLLEVETRHGHVYKTRYVLVTLPPQLALHALTYGPPLADHLQQAMGRTQTWMGRAMKVIVRYKQPFWRSKGLSGIGINFAGPVFRFHDASTADRVQAALFGWVTEGHPIHTVSPSDRQAAIITQLVRMFGPEARKPEAYLECDWTSEPYTTVPQEAGLPIGLTLYGHPLLQVPIMNGRLFWAGTETSPIHGDYLDGAVYSGEQTARKILADAGNHSGQ